MSIEHGNTTPGGATQDTPPELLDVSTPQQRAQAFYAQLQAMQQAGRLPPEALQAFLRSMGGHGHAHNGQGHPHGGQGHFQGGHGHSHEGGACGHAHANLSSASVPGSFILPWQQVDHSQQHVPLSFSANQPLKQGKVPPLLQRLQLKINW